MSIPIGFFDFYAFMLPGILYLYVFNQASKTLNLGYFDLFFLKDNLWLGVGILFLAYIVGHIMDEFSFFWFRLFRIRRGSQYAYNEFKERRVPDVKFDHQSWTVLLGVIRRSNPDIAQKIELHLVNSVMLRNVGFAFALFVIVEILSIILFGASSASVILAVMCLVACLISIRQSVNYDKWFFEAVFEHAVSFGKTTNEVMNALNNEPVKKSTKVKGKK